ncbi:hypothetical protein HOM50_03845 [bacterium]|jgi:hypothetical protein|nr:hypothetical protein [bacterium]MBT5015511.1 hypothetical protein [bacterium]
MISTLRSTLKGPIVRVIMGIAVALFVLAMVLPGLLDKTFKGKTGDWVFEVNDYRISPAKFQRVVAEHRLQRSQMLQQLTEQYGPEMAQQLIKMSGLDAKPEKQARHSAIATEALSQLASKLNLDVPNELVVAQILAQLPPGMVDEAGNIDMRALQQLIPYATLDEFEDDMKTRMQNSQVLDMAEAGLYVPNFMLKNAYIQQFANKNYGVLFFPVGKYLTEAKKTALTDKELKAFFAQENKLSKRYWIPEKRSITVWEFNPVNYGIKVPAKEIERYYNTNKRQDFVESPTQVLVRKLLLPFDEKNPTKSRDQASKIHDALTKSPSTFSAVAQSKSIDKDKDSATRLGALTWVKRGELHEKIEKPLFALKGDSEITPIIHSPEGLEIYQRESKKVQVYKPLKSVEGEIRDKLLSSKFEKAFTLAQRRVINQYRDGEIADLEKFIDVKHGKKATYVVTKESNDVYAKKAFEVKRTNGLVGYTNSGDGYLLKVTNIEKSKEPSFDSVKAQVQKDLYSSKAQALMKKAVSNAQEAAKTKPLSKVATEMGGQYKTTGLINSEDQKKLEALQKDKFPLQALMGITQKDMVRKDITPEMGYLMVLLDVEPFNQEKYSEKKLALGQSLQQQQETLLKQGFIASLLQNATIKVNNKLTHY